MKKNVSHVTDVNGTYLKEGDVIKVIELTKQKLSEYVTDIIYDKDSGHLVLNSGVMGHYGSL